MCRFCPGPRRARHRTQNHAHDEALIGKYIMSLQTTRLELIIVADRIAGPVLVPAAAKVRKCRGPGEYRPYPRGRTRTSDEQTTAQDTATSDQESSDSQAQAIDPLSGVTMPDNTYRPTSRAPQPKMKQIAVVDARKCNGLKYKDLMYGEVTVQWVWEGGRRVPKKVCQVREPSGASAPGASTTTTASSLPPLPQQ